MYAQTGDVWYREAENVSRQNLQGDMWDFADGNKRLTPWRDAAGKEIMAAGYQNFLVSFQNQALDPSKWSIDQLKTEQGNPNLQAIHEKYVPRLSGPQRFSIWAMGDGVTILDPASRIKVGCVKMGMSADCGK